MIYAGIGSREPPPTILDYMKFIAMTLGDRGYTLRSGGAIGADAAFEYGAKHSKTPIPQIFKAADATREAIELASNYHPAWHNCDSYARRLHGRNAMIILGKDLKAPVNFVVCWTRGGFPVGGTATGIRIAKGKSIVVYNLGTQDGFNNVIQLLRTPNAPV